MSRETCAATWWFAGSRGGKSLEISLSVACLEHLVRGLLTLHHVLHSLLVVLAEVYNASFGFSERAAARAIEEARARADDGSVDGPSPAAADNGQI